MTRRLPRVVPDLCSGREPFNRGGSPLGYTLLDYWRWSGFELLSNVGRGVLAEFLVANALGLTAEAREEWSAFDLEKWGSTIEVKSAAYIQAWAQKECSKIEFDIARKKSAFDPKTGTDEKLDPPKRVADIYVFCLLKHQCQETVDPLDVEQWAFYVVPTSRLDRERSDGESMGLNSLERMVEAVSYDELSDEVLKAID